MNEPLAPFTVTVEDESGNVCPETGGLVSLSFDSGAGGMFGNLVAPVVNGVATFYDVHFDSAGYKRFSAHHNWLGRADLEPVAVMAFGIPWKLVFSVQPKSGSAKRQSPWDVQPQIRVTDRYGNTVAIDSNSIVTLRCTEYSRCNLLGDITMHMRNGVAQFNRIRTQELGLKDIVIEAAASGLVSAQSDSFDGNMP